MQQLNNGEEDDGRVDDGGNADKRSSASKVRA
jgi:hypothetical protein